MERLKDTTALITGAARGLGAQIAQRFAESGAFVFVNDLNIDAANDIAKKINGKALACDVADSSAVRAMFNEIAGTDRSLNILVNNAGISGMEGDDGARDRYLETMETDDSDSANHPPILDVSDKQWQKMLDVHIEKFGKLNNNKLNLK